MIFTWVNMIEVRSKYCQFSSMSRVIFHPLWIWYALLFSHPITSSFFSSLCALGLKWWMGWSSARDPSTQSVAGFQWAQAVWEQPWWGPECSGNQTSSKVELWDSNTISACSIICCCRWLFIVSQSIHQRPSWHCLPLLAQRDEWMTFDFLAMKTTSTSERRAEKERLKAEERAKAEAIEQVCVCLWFVCSMSSVLPLHACCIWISRKKKQFNRSEHKYHIEIPC